MNFIKTNKRIMQPIQKISDVVEIFGVIDKNRTHNFVIRKHSDGSISLTKFTRQYSSIRNRMIWTPSHFERTGG